MEEADEIESVVGATSTFSVGDDIRWMFVMSYMNDWRWRNSRLLVSANCRGRSGLRRLSCLFKLSPLGLRFDGGLK